ncbi:hypothetical protein C4D60_Mb05t01770 [Musa balbisiana]|uniref:Uncharacterized protein n=1 Tax=Musa balbisiana TaxID=52838 RepID=A0A4S8JT10_MUSBA|nr:hypothetical protein C4D60_Mb05t01770 [Musa balbisiana]
MCKIKTHENNLYWHNGALFLLRLSHPLVSRSGDGLGFRFGDGADQLHRDGGGRRRHRPPPRGRQAVRGHSPPRLTLARRRVRLCLPSDLQSTSTHNKAKHAVMMMALIPPISPFPEQLACMHACSDVLE